MGAIGSGRLPARIGAWIVCSTLVGSLAVGCSAVKLGDTPPVSVEEAGLSAQAWVVPQTDVQSFVEARGGTMANFVPIGADPVAVVRLSWTTRDLPAPDRYNVVVIDPSGQQAAVDLQTDPMDTAISLGWDGRYSVLPDRYPFLVCLRGNGMDMGRLAPMAVSFRPGMRGPLWIVARFPRSGAMGLARPHDVPTVAVFLTGADERIWWADEVVKGSSRFSIMNACG